MGDIADFSELGDFLDLPIRTYSSGDLALAVFDRHQTEAEILLMDEWIGAGDQDFISKADIRLRKLVDSAHILIFASHNQILLEKLCTRGIVLMGGRVVFDGPVGEAIGLLQRAEVARWVCFCAGPRIASPNKIRKKAS